MLLALGRLAATGSSELPWSQAETDLARLISEYGPTTAASQPQRAAYPFTRLRSDGVWQLDHDVPMDLVGPLTNERVVGRFDTALEAALLADPRNILTAARGMVSSHFPDTIAPDVLTAVGLDPDTVLGTEDTLPDPEIASKQRRRWPSWRLEVLQAWDDQCAFCGYDGRLNMAPVGIEAAHVRWFAFDGPDTLDNALALCMLHHKLFDRGALGIDHELRVRVSETFTARTHAGSAIYDLHGHELQPRPGTPLPAARTRRMAHPRSVQGPGPDHLTVPHQTGRQSAKTSHRGIWTSLCRRARRRPQAAGTTSGAQARSASWKTSRKRTYCNNEDTSRTITSVSRLKLRA